MQETVRENKNIDLLKVKLGFDMKMIVLLKQKEVGPGRHSYCQVLKV